MKNMKNTVIALAAALVASAALADRTAQEIRAEAKALNAALAEAKKPQAERDRERRAYWSSLTDAEVRAYLDDVVEYGSTNGLAAGELFNRKVRDYMFGTGLHPLGYMLGTRYDALRAEYDAKLSQLGFTLAIQSLDKWPKLNEEFLTRSGYRERRPAYMRHYAKAMEEGRGLLGVDGLADRIELVAENTAYSFGTNGWWFLPMNVNRVNGNKKYLKDVVLRHIKHTLRKQGKSFVAVDGVNPIERPMADFAAALDSPRMSGLKAWCDEWCPEASAFAASIPAATWDDAKLADYKEKIMYGDIEFNDIRKGILLLCMGVDAYNAFVKEYNEGSEGGK